jgi:hypothetical protein
MAYVAPTNVATGDVLTASRYNADVVENVSQIYASQRRIALATVSAGVATGATVGATEVFTDLTFTAAGSTTYLVHVFLPYVETGTSAGSYIEIYLTNGSTTAIGGGWCGLVGKSAGTYSVYGIVNALIRYTPAAGSVTLNVSGKHIISAGAMGGQSTATPAFLAVYGPEIS